MNEKEILDFHYSPIQPSAKQASGYIDYQEISPCRSLENLIFCYWQLKTSRPLKEDYEYRVVADGCIDIFFDLNNPVDSSVMGFCRKFTTFPIGKDFNYIGIRFFPSIFSQLFSVNAKALSNKSTPLTEVQPQLARLIKDSFSPSHQLHEIASVFNNFLGQFIKDHKFDLDGRFYDAINIILLSKGKVDIETELNTGLSPRQLRRVFNYYIGTTPKSFSKVVRFQYILNASHSNKDLKTNKYYYEMGYYDQAHFIKEFKNYYGVTPKEAFL
ncbi:helix-turn-helix domain-containing protein [Portibacter lacus]|uniref:Transcriptional regulator n=1 Tax=Portibacter lacus TaxID=1099794 RepID=A0AA37WEX3_9BACT|nr:helix-turn-helix domain-containing protein [Portibacter lacus]GLR17862.1 transcriptional regulator [Portibacter lacus]